MGRITEMHHAAERRAMEMTARSALDPFMERLDQLVAEMQAIAGSLLRVEAALTTVPQRIEEGEAGRAERLHQAIAPLVQETIDAATRLSTEISSAAERQRTAGQALVAQLDRLRQDLAEHRPMAPQARLRSDMALLMRLLGENKALMAALPDAVADQVTGAVEALHTSLSARAGIPGSSGPTPASAPTDRLQAQAWRILWNRVARNEKSRGMMELVLAEARSRLDQAHQGAKGGQAAR